MAAYDDLLAEFEAYQKDITESAQKAQAKSAKGTFTDGDMTPMVRFGLSKGETSKVFKGYFVTMPGDDGYKFSRRIDNIKQFGCNKDIYGISGFKAISPNSYENIDEETTVLLQKYDQLWEKLYALDVSSLKNEDDKFYIMRQPTLDIWYMYLTDGVEKPGYYLCTTKSKAFVLSKAEWMKTTKEALESAGADPTNLLRDFVDNTVTKTNKISIEITQDRGYSFKFSSMKMKLPNDQILFDQADLDKLEPLSKCFVNKTTVNKESLKKAIEALSTMIAKAEMNQAKADAVAPVESAFED